ncbi:MAG: response regulator transcription factor [Verrucomicrobia bacterium]|nr:response regulator transcription factor [Verrucomicrobiota bacterium]
MSNNAVTQIEEAPAATAPGPENQQPTINIWLVDDNQPLRATLKEIFESCGGIQCTATFHSPNAVLSALASKTGPDVILLDIHMGKANGLDAIRPIKALSRSTQVLMFTTFFDSKSKQQALTAGASGFLLKHFPLEQIVDSIHEASRNPVPHLKRSRVQRSTVTPAPETKEAVESAQSMEAKPSCRPQRRLSWVKQCLNLMHLRHN